VCTTTLKDSRRRLKSLTFSVSSFHSFLTKPKYPIGLSQPKAQYFFLPCLEYAVLQ
jgi:hypothetical protein